MVIVAVQSTTAECK